MAGKTPPFKEYPAWTTSRFFQFIRASLRRTFTRWPPKYTVLEKNKKTLSAKQKSQRKVRHTYEYRCAVCKDFYKRSEVEVDHIVPVGSLKTYEDLPGFVERMFVSEDKLQVLCKPCHKAKGKKDENTVD